MSRYLIMRWEITNDTTPESVIREVADALLTEFDPHPAVFVHDSTDIEHEDDANLPRTLAEYKRLVAVERARADELAARYLNR